jgi:quercetin dioxygenase-like cupin family protein
MRSLLAPLLSLIASVALAQGAPTAEAAHAIVALPDQLTWGPAPPILPAGARLAVLEGDPTAPGPFTMRLQMPDHYRIPPHYHPATEHVTVVKGAFKVGMGDKFEASALKRLPAGTFAALEPGFRHFAESEGETIIQLHGIGPWGLVYVNPADDPRQRKP